ncbi:MAG: hypothetical protein ACLSUS_03790 [Opitutales bacterium]
MKIESVTNKKYHPNFKSSSNGDYARLSGKNIFDKYNAERARETQEQQEKYTEVQGIIYNSIGNLAALGKYDAAKLLFKEIENEEELKTDFVLYETMANLYKKENDLHKAEELFETAYNNSAAAEIHTFANIEKNYIETQMLLNNNNTEEALKELRNRNDIFSDISFLELDALNNLKKGEKHKAKNEILSAYFLAQNNNIVEDDLYYKAAVVYSSIGNCEKSNEICKTRLDKLNKEKKIYTHEFLNYLTLLGINTANRASNEKDEQTAYETLKNARDIEEKIPNKSLKETIEYNLLKLEFKKPDNNTLSKTNTFLENNKNVRYKKELSLLAGDYCVDKDNELALLYYTNAEECMDEQKDTESSQRLALYNKIIAVAPQKYGEYLSKINNLSEKKDLSVKQLIDILEENINKKDYENTIKIANDVINNSQSTEKNKEIAKTYRLLANIEKGGNFHQNVSQLNSNLDNLDALYDKEKSNDKDGILSKHLYRAYTRLSSINYDASAYYQSAQSAQKAQKYIDSMSPKEEDLKKSKILLTMLWYRAKCYYDAEKSCLEYLKMLTGKEVSQIKNKPVNLILKEKSDEESRKIAAAIETLGIINLKNKNYQDAKEYYSQAIDLRENLRKKDLYLANDYAALARIAIVGYNPLKENLSSKDLHNKCLAILKDKYPNDSITKEEEEFHKKYYGISLASFGKFLFCRDANAIIDKFKCYNKELNICE